MATEIPVRSDIAMTGEVTLRGRVLPVGGIREKALAANRAGLKTVLLPRKNMADLAEVPAELTRKMRFVAVDSMDEVLQVALEESLEKQAAAMPRTAHPGEAVPIARAEKG